MSSTQGQKLKKAQISRPENLTVKKHLFLCNTIRLRFAFKWKSYPQFDAENSMVRKNPGRGNKTDPTGQSSGVLRLAGIVRYGVWAINSAILFKFKKSALSGS